MGGLGCDNMTVVLVCLLHGQPYQVLVDRCAGMARTRAVALQQEDLQEEEVLEQTEKVEDEEVAVMPAIT